MIDATVVTLSNEIRRDIGPRGVVEDQVFVLPYRYDTLDDERSTLTIRIVGFNQTVDDLDIGEARDETRPFVTVIVEVHLGFGFSFRIPSFEEKSISISRLSLLRFASCSNKIRRFTMVSYFAVFATSSAWGGGPTNALVHCFRNPLGRPNEKAVIDLISLFSSPSCWGLARDRLEPIGWSVIWVDFPSFP